MADPSEERVVGLRLDVLRDTQRKDRFPHLLMSSKGIPFCQRHLRWPQVRPEKGLL